MVFDKCVPDGFSPPQRVDPKVVIRTLDEMQFTTATEVGVSLLTLTKLALLPIERDFIARRIEECEAATKL
jgi:hypothetical protein